MATWDYTVESAEITPRPRTLTRAQTEIVFPGHQRPPGKYRIPRPKKIILPGAADQDIVAASGKDGVPSAAKPDGLALIGPHKHTGRVRACLADHGPKIDRQIEQPERFDLRVTGAKLISDAHHSCGAILCDHQILAVALER